VYASGTATKIAEYRILPDVSGYGEQDLSRLLQSYVSYNFLPTSNNGYDASSSFYKYDVKVGEEYVTEVNYTSSLVDNGGNVRITATHAFQVGDQVVIAQDDLGVANPNLEGLFTVLSIQTTTTFTVNSLWADVTDATINGTVKYADNRKTVTRDVITSTNNYVFNGAVPFTNWITYDSTVYLLTAGTDKLLTSMRTRHSLTLDEDMWLNFGVNSVTTGYAYFLNSTGDIFRKLLNTNTVINQVGVGCNNLGTLSLVSGSGSLIEDDVEWYAVWYANSAGSPHSQRYYIDIDRRCVINDYSICFLDRMGSIGSFAFQLRQKVTGTIQRDVYNQHIAGAVTSEEWGYKTYAQGMKVINPSIEETYELQTNWMTEADGFYFNELLSSPQTWLNIDGANYVACIVQDTGYEKEFQRNRNLIRKTVRVKLAVQDVVNG
jgi:hypothetical protein